MRVVGMKRTQRHTIGAILFTGILIASGLTIAQTGGDAASPFSTAQGFISDIGPDGFLVRSGQETPPLRCTITEKTAWVNEEGKPVIVTAVQSNQPVTVYCIKSGDQLIASKIVVKRALGMSTAPLEVIGTTTVTEVTLLEARPNRIIPNPVMKSDPVHYNYGETSTFVDRNGRPVALEEVNTGPVTVYYTHSGRTLIANDVIVRRVLSAPGTAGR